jgi:hypothetical protein
MMYNKPRYSILLIEISFNSRDCGEKKNVYEKRCENRNHTQKKCLLTG